jgi:ATP-dependent RNA helicase RhlE
VSFEGLGLSPELLRAVADQGYETPTPVQSAAIPLVLAGRDVLAGAQTGTGKTAAFVLPIIQRLHETRRDGGAARHPVRVLVVVPTRELAIQVEESVRTYGAHRPVRSATVYGGVGFGPQLTKLRAGPEIVVATPGRLLDHLGQGTINLSSVEVLVLDEADRMLDMGFIRDIRKILAVLPPKRQNLLFSATFSDEITGLADGLLTNPAHVQVTPRNTTTELIDQLVIPVDRERKRDLMRELVALGRVKQALVFTRTKHGANRLAEQLRRDGIEAAAIHGNRSQSQRVKALSDFKEGRCAILVATDIAARGLDIEQLPHVINFELPMVPEDYVHRIGRTGRAGVDGQAISLVCVDETPLLRAIQGLLKRQITSEVIAGFEPDRSIRPEAIRLRSTPAERREIALSRGVRQAANRPAPAGSRGIAPSRHAGAAREETFVSRAARPHPGTDARRTAGADTRMDAARSELGAPRPGASAGRPGPGAPRPNGDSPRSGMGGARSGGAPRSGGGRRGSGRGQGNGTPGTGFGNAAPGQHASASRPVHGGAQGRPSQGAGHAFGAGRSQAAGRPQGSAHPQAGGRPHGAGAPHAAGRPEGPARQDRNSGRPGASNGRSGGGRDGSAGHGGAPRSLPGERLSRLG